MPKKSSVFDLPEGFSYKIISVAGDKMDDGFFIPGKMDGMATFPGPDGRTIIVRNHELSLEDDKEGPFGEKNKLTGTQGYEDLPPDSRLEGLLLPQPPGKEYRLLKIVTQPATPEQLARLGNDRAPVVVPAGPRADSKPT